jgi:hypothetical protein
MTWTQGHEVRATALLNESLALWRELGYKTIQTGLIGLGYIAQCQGDAARARGCFAEALALCRELGDQRWLALCLSGLAGVAAMQGQPVRAARLLGAAEALAELIHHTALRSGHRMEFERNVALARAQVDEATFAAA